MKNIPRLLLTVFLSLLPLLSGCGESPAPAAALTVVFVNVSYPGSNPQAIAKTIAAPLEQELHGAAGLIRSETYSSNGSYVAQLYFDSTADSAALEELVQERLDLAKPKLPAGAQIMSVAVKPPKAALNPTQVTIALLDQKNRDWQIRQKHAEALLKQFAAENVLNNLTIYPTAEKQVVIMTDSDKLARLGISKAELNAALPPDARDMPIDELQQLTIGEQKIPLSSLVEFHEELAPNTIYRVNQFPALRITGVPSPDSTIPDAGAKAVELAETELQRQQFKNYAIVNLSEK